jgi:hypothetical protein
MMSLSCSTIVELFQLLSKVLMAMTASNAVVESSNQWSTIHCMCFGSPLPECPAGLGSRRHSPDSRFATMILRLTGVPSQRNLIAISAADSQIVGSPGLQGW